MADPVNTLNSIDFNQIIGGPLQAGVNASAAAALATYDYIMFVGFGVAPGTAVTTASMRTVTFNFSQVNINNSSAGGFSAVTASITVPIISILPVPYLQIDSMDIELKVQFDSLSSTSNTNIFNTTTSATGGTSGILSLFENVKWSVSAADQNVNTQVSEQQSRWTYDVRVHAGVAPMPAGMAKVLDIFENTIQAIATTN